MHCCFSFTSHFYNKESLCDSLRARVGTQVHLQLHTGRIPAEHFYFIGKGISYKVKKGRRKTAIHEYDDIYWKGIFPRIVTGKWESAFLGIILPHKSIQHVYTCSQSL